MKSETKRSLLRVLKISTAIIALPIIALAPVYVASVILTDQVVETSEPTGHAANINIADIDRNGTVMYAVSPSYSQPGFETESLTEALLGSDLITVTFQDSDSSRYQVNHETDEECGLTLQLSSDDRYDADTKTYVGYIRVEDGELEIRHPNQHQLRLEVCRDRN